MSDETPTSLSEGWVPSTVTMEGMFLIDTTPKEMRQHIFSHFRNGATKFHDDPDCQIQSRKFFERHHRDLTSEDHTVENFQQT